VLQPHAAAAPAMQQSISPTAGPTAANLLRAAAVGEWDRQMDIVLLHRSCSVYYAGSADKHRTLYTDTLPFVTNKKLTFSVRAVGHDKLENVGIEMNVVWAKYTGDEFDAVFHVVIVVILQTLNKNNVNAD